MPLTPIGTHRLAEQIGGWAVFADIELITIARSGNTPLVSLDAGVSVDDAGRYVCAIGFGTAYALEYMPGSDPVGVFVTKLHINPVDTTPMALAFATCHAVLNSLNLKPEAAPYFERSTRSFVIPGRGTVDG
ncbi:MAG: hypothetical protein ACKVH8_23675 [Pirellulales bacterium]